jgi:hypothetical protein
LRWLKQDEAQDGGETREKYNSIRDAEVPQSLDEEQSDLPSLKGNTGSEIILHGLRASEAVNTPCFSIRTWQTSNQPRVGLSGRR